MLLLPDVSLQLLEGDQYLVADEAVRGQFHPVLPIRFVIMLLLPILHVQPLELRLLCRPVGVDDHHLRKRNYFRLMVALQLYGEEMAVGAADSFLAVVCEVGVDEGAEVAVGVL